MSRKMYQVWAKQDDPAHNVLLGDGEPFPVARFGEGWKLLGRCEVANDIADDIERNGFYSIRTNVPFDPVRIYGSNPIHGRS